MGCTNILRPSRRALRALLRMRYFPDGIKKNVILRKPRSGCLEGPTVLIPSIRGKIQEL
jgi:hypothetical protein